MRFDFDAHTCLDGAIEDMQPVAALGAVAPVDTVDTVDKTFPHIAEPNIELVGPEVARRREIGRLVQIVHRLQWGGHNAHIVLRPREAGHSALALGDQSSQAGAEGRTFRRVVTTLLWRSCLC